MYVERNPKINGVPAFREQKLTAIGGPSTQSYPTNFCLQFSARSNPFTFTLYLFGQPMAAQFQGA